MDEPGSTGGVMELSPQPGAADETGEALDSVTVIANAMWDAMIAEGIPTRTRRAVISRVLYGHPGGFEVSHPQYGSPGFHDYVGKSGRGDGGS